VEVRTVVLQPGKSAETMYTLMQLRSRQEILERWLASQVLTDGLQQGLRAMLAGVEEQLRAVTDGLPR
jgi:hypothetical protein